MSNELKPCRFCGSTDLFVKRAVIAEYHDETPFIQCDSCGFAITDKELCIDINCGPKENEKFMDRQAASKWNTRPVEDKLKAEITRYRRALHNLKEDCTQREHFAVSDEEKLFLAEAISHIEAELDFSPDTEKGREYE